MSMDRNVWIYGTGLLIVVGGCFAIGYTILPTKPAFGTKQVVSVPVTDNPNDTMPQPKAEPQVPKLVIEDITAEKAASAKESDAPLIATPEPDEQPSEELDIKVDTTKNESGSDVTVESPSDETPATSPVNESQKPIKATRSKQDLTANKQDTKSAGQPPTDDSVALFRVRIATIKTTRKEANALVSELKDKGFAATVLPLAGSFVVQTGAFKDRKSAEALQKTLTDNGYDTSITN